jgi:hypothetical protein
MKLNPFGLVAAVPYSHDFAFFRFGAYFKALGKIFP